MSSAGEQDHARSRSRLPLPAGAVLLAVGLSAIVYRHLTRVYFFADDFVCLFNIVNEGFLRFVPQPFGGHLLLVRNAVFYASHALFGFQARPYYAVALLTHLLNVWLFCRVAYRLTGSAALACLGAALWGTSPLCLGTLGWYSVYGQVLVATILLLVLGQVAALPERGARIPARAGLGWYVLLLAATMCFGTGIGVALAFPVVLFLLVPSALRQRGVCVAFVMLLVVVPAFYYGFQHLYYRFVAVRPMSEAFAAAAALSSYRPIGAMLWHLTAFAITGLVQGFFFVPDDYPGTASNVIVALFLAALVAVLLRSDAATRRRVASLVVLTVSVYALVAMGRSNLYILFHIEPGAAARLLRYHYVGIIPLALLVCVMLARAARGRGWRAAVPGGALVAWIALMGGAFVRWPLRIDDRPAVRSYVSVALRQIASEIAAHPPGHDVYIENTEAPGYVLGPMLHQQDFPGLAGLFVLTYPTNVVDGRRVYFVERRPLVLRMARDPASNHRLAGLLVAAEDAAGP